MRRASGNSGTGGWLRLALPAALLVLPLMSSAADPATLGLRKLGEGRLSYFGISLYTASLWSESAPAKPDPAEEPLLLQINYERNISRDRIMAITRKEWRRLNVAPPEQQLEWLARLEAILPDVRSGDSLSSYTVPGRETRFFFGGEQIGLVDDPAFGEAFLAIWLDPRTRAAKLRNQLLAES